MSLYQLQMDGHWELLPELEPTVLPPMSAKEEAPVRKRRTSRAGDDGLVWVKDHWFTFAEYVAICARVRERRGQSCVRVGF